MAQETPAPIWFSVAIMAGLVWNIFGLVQFLGGVGRTVDDYIAQGMASPQAEAMASYPAWLDWAFALGVLAGLAGCIFVLMRRPVCVPVLAASVVGFVAMMIGNGVTGLFDVMGPQRFWTMLFTVIVSLALLSLAIWARQRRIIV